MHLEQLPAPGVKVPEPPSPIPLHLPELVPDVNAKEEDDLSEDEPIRAQATHPTTNTVHAATANRKVTCWSVSMAVALVVAVAGVAMAATICWTPVTATTVTALTLSGELGNAIALTQRCPTRHELIQLPLTHPSQLLAALVGLALVVQSICDSGALQVLRMVW